jgi:hypothetical protein
MSQMLWKKLKKKKGGRPFCTLVGVGRQPYSVFTVLTVILALSRVAYTPTLSLYMDSDKLTKEEMDGWLEAVRAKGVSEEVIRSKWDKDASAYCKG